MAKTKEAKWTEQKMLHKLDQHGEVILHAYRKFGWETWRRMTEDERAMWVELDEATPVPISKEVIEFNKREEAVIPDVFEDEDVDAVAEYDELDAIKAELKERGIRFSHNSKIETLRKKLADADNTE